MRRALTRCGDHGFAPGSIVCVHLLSGDSKEWPEIPADYQGDPDYLCPACMDAWEREAQGIGELPLDDLKTVCMHCVRAARQRHGIPDAASE